MSKIKWDQVGERFYETGVSKGVLYPYAEGQYGKGVAWNGLTAVNQSPSGAEPTALYADNIKYLNLMSAEEFGATIEAYTYPDEFAACNGELSLDKGVTVGQQKRSIFGLSYQNYLEFPLLKTLHLFLLPLESLQFLLHSLVEYLLLMYQIHFQQILHQKIILQESSHQQQVLVQNSFHLFAHILFLLVY